MSRNSDVPDAPSPDGENQPRRSSFGFLRSRSTERMSQNESAKNNGRNTVTPRRSFSNGRKLVKKGYQREVEEVLRQAKEDIPEVPPIIPSISHQPQMQTFGGDNAKPMETRVRSGSSAHEPPADMGGPVDNIPLPPVPGSFRSESVDNHARSESMTNRGRYSYASSIVSTVNGPRKVRRRKDPTPFNILVVGATNAGKTSFIDFLRTSCALPARKQRQSMQRHNSIHEDEVPKQTSISPAFQYHYLETEIGDGERIGLTLWDSESLEKNVVDLQLREIVSFIESKFEETYSEENRLVRSPGVRDTHIHCVFLVLDPLRLDLTMAAAKKALLRSNPSNGARTKDNNPLIEAKIMDEALDLQVIRVLKGKTAVIPVISKADTVTNAHMNVLKKSVWNVLKRNDLDPLEALGIELAESESDQGSDSESPARSAKTEDSDIVHKVETELPPLPLSILTPDPPDIHHNDSEKIPGNVGRAFPWGFADPYDTTHCDFVSLKKIVLGDWRAELRGKSRDVWYENWRTAQLKGNRMPRPPSSKANPRGLPHSLAVGHGRGGVIREHSPAQRVPYRPGQGPSMHPSMHPRSAPTTNQSLSPPHQAPPHQAPSYQAPPSRGQVAALPKVTSEEVGVAR